LSDRRNSSSAVPSRDGLFSGNCIIKPIKKPKKWIARGRLQQSAYPYKTISAYVLKAGTIQASLAFREKVRVWRVCGKDFIRVEKRFGLGGTQTVNSGIISVPPDTKYYQGAICGIPLGF